MSGIKYEGSELWKSIEFTNSSEQLANKFRYIEMAIETHKKENNIEQANFFIDALNHWCDKCSGKNERLLHKKKDRMHL